MLTVGAGLVWPPPARAEDVPAADPAPPQPAAFQAELTVVGRAVTSPATAATVIDRATIEAANVRSATELIRHVAGTFLASYGSRGGSSAAQIRGGDPNFTLVLLDGIPMNDPTDIEGGSFNLGSLPVGSIERLEVVRGPHSFFFGSSAMAGVINIVTRRGQAGQPRVEGSLELGDASLFRGSAAISGRGGAADYFVGASWEEEDGRIRDDSFEQLDLHGNFGWQLGERARLRTTVRISDWQAEDYPEGSGGPIFGSGDRRRTESAEQYLGVDLALSDGGRWQHNLSVSSSRIEVERASPAIFPVVPPSQEDRAYQRQRLGWLGQAELSPSALLTLGVSAEREDADNDSLLLLPPFLGGAVSGDYRLERTTPGAFVELQLERGGLLVEAGLRADLPEDLDTAWSPRVAFSYRLPETGWRLRSSWSRAFKLPGIFALASPPQLGGNPDLRPERAVGFDLGAEYEADGGRLRAGLSLFVNRYSDLIDFDFDAFKSLNVSRVEAEGAEISLRWAPDPRWTVRSDLTWQDVDDPDTSQPLRNHPDYLGSLRLTWKPRPPLSLALDARYVGPSFDEQLPVPQLDSVDGYEVVDLSFTWALAESWRIRGRLENLADEQYQSFIGFPQPGRSARIGLQYRSR